MQITVMIAVVINRNTPIQFQNDDFFELLLLANMLGLKYMEVALLGHLNNLNDIVQDTKFVCRGNEFYSKIRMRQLVIDFFIEIWVFCRRYPVIADSLYMDPLDNQPAPTISLRNFVVKSLQPSDVLKVIYRSKYLLTFACDDLIDFLGDMEMTNQKYNHAFAIRRLNLTLAIASTWLHEHHGEVGQNSTDDMECHFESIMAYLKLTPLSKTYVESLWGQDSPLTRRIFALGALQQSREFLIISDNGKARETPGFICHNVESGESFYLDPPKSSNRNQFCGTPKLCQEGDRLYCICCVKGATLSFLYYKYSFTRNSWVPCLDLGDPTPNIDLVTESPPELVEFFVPSDSYNMKLVVGVDRESQKDVMTWSEHSEHDSNRDNTLQNITQVLVNGPYAPGESRISNLEVCGAASYHRGFNGTGPVIFGNSAAKDGFAQKESVALILPSTELEGLPDGPCASPLSIVSEPTGSLFILPSVPSKANNGDVNVGHSCVRSPRVWVLPSKGDRRRPSKKGPYLSLQTPTCPDLDYASLYYDRHGRICLVLVQKPTADSPFSQVYDRKSTESAKRRSSGGDRKVETIEVRDEKVGKRIIGRYALKVRPEDINSKTPRKRLGDVWEPLPISDALADFLSLGCHLPGEVRITSACLNPNNLRPIKLVRETIGDGPDYNVVVANNGDQGSPTQARPWTPWFNHENSPFRDVPSTVIDRKLNACVKKNGSLLDSLKERRLLGTIAF